MKVKMLEELVSRIDGKPASWAPLFLGSGGWGRKAHPVILGPPPLLHLLRGRPGIAGAGATPVPFMKAI